MESGNGPAATPTSQIIRRLLKRPQPNLIENDTNIKRMLLSGIITTDSLAYLWMAVENGANILVFGDPSETRLVLVIAGMLAPGNQTIATIWSTPRPSEFSPFIGVREPHGFLKIGFSQKDQIRRIISQRPNAIIIERLTTDLAKEAFKAARTGIKFVAGMETDGSTAKSHTENPALKKMKISSNNMLDISFSLKDGKLYNIEEYEWLSRAEFRVDETKLSGEPIKDPLTLRILEDGTFKKEALVKSKVIKAYSEINFINEGKSIKEFERRSRFMENIARSKENESDYIIKYWAIK
ncbi:MAG: hypothetical protein M1504_03700 [Candidatus Marsarchaeota archaeon]|nr:hypothetical protein [Candidatus Marsarchaeota archaeon]